ncbi:MAG: PadR family transcriptional regulator [Candidatus Doudnabacteria bacterium]|nr:PadR family transcriptional regulator [Candidatus Doudnabacteria bacterium]
MTDQEYIDNATAQMRKGILEYCIMLTISKEELYASDILNKLKSFNLIVVEGTLYPILSRLKEAELVSYTWVESKEGPPRKYYELTSKGEKTVELLTQSYETLNKSINQLIKKS